MKNIQIFDGADNARYSIFQATEAQFAAIFPGEGQDIEFIEDVVARLSEDQMDRAFAGLWDRPIHRRDAQGIHGTLFYEWEGKGGHWPASKRQIDVDPLSINQAERDLYERLRAE